VFESHASYGGLGQRLSDASRIQGGRGWNFAVDDQLRSLVGRTLCRPCTGDLPHVAVMAWWFALPVLAGLGLAVAIRAGRGAPTLALLACAVSAAAPYLFLIGYAAPRFLLPAYALLAIPVGDALVCLVTGPNGAWRPVVGTVVVLGLVGHVSVQYVVLAHTVKGTVAVRDGWSRTVMELSRLGVRPPCLLTGHNAIPIAFYAGCASAHTSGNNANVTREGILRGAERMPVAVLVAPGGGPPEFARGWPSHVFGELRVHVAPGRESPWRPPPAVGQEALVMKPSLTLSKMGR
jgi:hypothetical protein